MTPTARTRHGIAAAFLVMLGACSSPNPDPTASDGPARSEGPASATPPPTVPAGPDGPVACLDGKLLWADELETLVLAGCVDQFDLASVEMIWGWDGATWELLSDDGPPAHVVTGFAWDADRDVLVRYGGIPLQGQTCNPETWEWDMAEWHLVDVEPPTPCDHVELAWDGVDGRLLLFGGGRGEVLDTTTWAWDGDAWAQVAIDGPDPRAHHAMVGGTGTIPGGRPFVHGGFDGSRMFGDSWVWDGSGWEESDLDGGMPPSARSHHGLAVGAPGPLVFGGATSTSTFDSLVDETWFYEYFGWRQVAADGPHPSARGLPALGYDVAREVFVLYGGFTADGAALSDTWEFRGGAWSCLEGC